MPRLRAAIRGHHYNIGTFTVSTGAIIRVQPFNGTTFGVLRAEAKTAIRIEGTLSADLAGYPGGAGGTSDGGNQSFGGYGGAGPGAGARGMASKDANNTFLGRPRQQWTRTGNRSVQSHSRDDERRAPSRV